MISCSKPGCENLGAAVLGYDYASRRALLLDTGPGRPSPHLYALCSPCAERLSPPRGWVLEDCRSKPSLFFVPGASGGAGVDAARPSSV